MPMATWGRVPYEKLANTTSILNRAPAAFAAGVSPFCVR